MCKLFFFDNCNQRKSHFCLYNYNNSSTYEHNKYGAFVAICS